MTKRPKRALLFWVRAVPRVSVVASIDRTRFAPWEAGFSVPRLLRRRNSPRDLANTAKRGRFRFHNGTSAKDACRPPIEMSPLSPFQMSLSSPDGCWERVTDDGDCDEPHGDRSDARAQGSGRWPDYGE